MRQMTETEAVAEWYRSVRPGIVRRVPDYLRRGVLGFSEVERLTEAETVADLRWIADRLDRISDDLTRDPDAFNPRPLWWRRWRARRDDA